MTENTTFGEINLRDVTKHRSLWGDVWRQFRKHKGALTGVFVFSFITLAVFIGPYIHDIDPSAINFKERNFGPTLSHPLGTDNIGHDTLAQMLAGGQVSLAVGFLAMMIALLLGTMIGILAGFVKFDAFDGFISGITNFASFTGHNFTFQGYITCALWSGGRNFYADSLCYWHHQLDAYCKDSKE